MCLCSPLACAHMKFSPKLIFRLVCACLFVSGMAGLVYEIVWARYLALFLGHTSYAVVAVLVAFMGGLALGNLWFGSLADRTRRPLARYAWLEIGIGIYALVFPTYYEFCHMAFVNLARGWQPGSTALLGLKFVFSLVTILLPTVLMGGTLPLLVRVVTRSLGELRPKVAALYFVNSAGAVAGTWLADFCWLPVIGLASTMIAGAAMNLAVGCLALFVSGASKEGQGIAEPLAEPAASEPAFAVEESFSSAELRLAVIGIGLSGFVAMLYQVAWTRFLALALGSSTHAFSLMLITFIAGIAAGSWLVYQWTAMKRALLAFAWTEIALAVSMAMSLFLYQYLAFTFVRASQVLVRESSNYPIYEFLQGAICFAVMFVPTVCLGMTLPLVSRVATEQTARAGRSVGRVFAVNTLGTVLGAAATGLVLMPMLGLSRTFALGIALNLFIGLTLLALKYAPGRLAWLLATPLVSVVLVFGAGRMFDHTWRPLLTSGLWRTQQPPTTWKDAKTGFQRNRMLYYRDGAGSTVSVAETVPGGLRFLKVNGKTDAGTGDDMITQLMVGHTALLMHPTAQDVLMIGLGSGMSAGSVLTHPSVKHVDQVEISPEVVQANRFFTNVNHNPLGDPRLHLVVEDAKSFLQITDHKYDAIISEPSNPWMAGVAGVFSTEFYQTCRQHLAPGGLMLQWVQLYELSDDGLDMVIATFSQSFPHMSLWQSHYNDLLLVGSVQPVRVDFAAFEQRLREPLVDADLAQVGLNNATLYLAQEMVSSARGRFIPAPDTRVHSDYYPTLEYLAQRDFFARPTVDRFRLANETLWRRPYSLLGQYLQAHNLNQEDFRAFAKFYLAGSAGYLDLFNSLLLRWEHDHPEDIEPYERGASVTYVRTPSELQARRLQAIQARIFERAATDPTLLRKYAVALMAYYREQRSIFFEPPSQELQEILLGLAEADQANARVYRAYLAELSWDRGDDVGCIEFAKQALGRGEKPSRGPFALDRQAPLRLATIMADALLRHGDCEQAVAVCENAIRSGYWDEKTRPIGLPFEMVQRQANELLAAKLAAGGQ